MTCKITNRSTQNMSQFEEIIENFYPYAQERLGFDKPVGVNLISDPENAKDPLGKTAYYDPNKMEITLFVDKRHVKDMLRSFSHELVHHSQNCRGEFDDNLVASEGYAQKDPHMRKMEAEAYLMGNGFLVRDWEDSLKEKSKMNEAKLREAIRGALQNFLVETKGSEPDFLDLDKDGDKEESMKDAAEDAKTESVDPVEEGRDHPGQSCDEAHSGESHDEYQANMAMHNKADNPHSLTSPVNESFLDRKSTILSEELMKKWCK